MSITLGATLRQSTILKDIFNRHDFYVQACLNEARDAGLRHLRDESEGPTNTPIGPPPDGGTLISTTNAGVNQYAVWFTIGGVINGRPYGFAQEGGWHDRGGGFHEGHHMVETAGQIAADTFVAFMGREASTLAIFSPAVHRFDGGNPGFRFG